MIPAEIIEKKRDGKILDAKEIEWFIENVTTNNIEKSQISALLMAIYFQGMNDEEMFSLVNSMVDSGKKFNFNDSTSYVADKHSTGGVGDKISFILTPILSSLGITIPMIAGRGLAFTGGTIDKFESIPNLRTSLNMDTFIEQVNSIGCCIASQSKEICPADRVLYSIRDLSGTVPSLPLIISSIMSKKIAEGLDGLVIDLKVGSGTFMKTLESAKKLGEGLKKIGENFDIKTDIVYTNMNQPLGKYAGLKCEIFESIDCLNGRGSDDLMNITLELGSRILLQSKLMPDKKTAKDSMKKTIENKIALNKFKEIVALQGGNIDSLEEDNSTKNNAILIETQESGYINSMKTDIIGWALIELGAGRKYKNDKIDYSAGIEFIKKTGDKVNKGDPIFKIFGRDPKRLNTAKKMLKKTYTIKNSEAQKEDLIIM